MTKVGQNVGRDLGLNCLQKLTADDKSTFVLREGSGSVVERWTQDQGGRRFKPHRRHCVVSLSKTHQS